MAALATYATRLYSELTPHPLNVKLYGKDDCRSKEFGELRDSLKEQGILTPLLITQDDVIISGHRRWAMAKFLQIASLPVVVFASTDPLDIEAAIIHANRQRSKSPEQMAREFKALKRIETEKAKQRQKATLKQNKAADTVSPILDERTGRADQLAAEAVGMKRVTAEKAAVVVDAIDAAEESGDTERAEVLRETLNTRSVSAAHRLVVPPKLIPEPTPGSEPKDERERDDGSWLQPDEAAFLDELKALWNRSNEYVRAAFLEWTETTHARM